jgi:Flp pilus assembly protein TadD
MPFERGYSHKPGGASLDVKISAIRSHLLQWPDDVEATAQLGLLLLQAGKAREACAHLRRAAGLRPGDLRIARALVNAETEIGDMGAALKTMTHLRASRPGDVELAFNHAQLLAKAGKDDQAIRLYEEIARARPELPAIHSNLGNMLTRVNRLADAVASFRRAIALEPHSAVYRFNLAKAYEELCDWRNAERAYRDALASDPNMSEAAWSLSQLLWLSGDMRGAWQFHDARLRLRRFAPRPEIRARPHWHGEDLTGRTLLFWAEQGHGDSIQFVRYVEALKARGARVVVECQPALKRLFQTLDGVDAVCARGDRLPAFDFQLPMMSAPGAFGTDATSIPQNVPYLRSPAEDRTRLPGDPACYKIGLVWAGNPANQPSDRRRSAHPRIYQPLFDLPCVQFYSLQVGEPIARLQELDEPGRIIDLSEKLTDFAATAAVIDQLDLVITTCTSVPHLVGALGREAWLLLGVVPDYRWFLAGEKTAWYPTLRLFRQSVRGEWGSVIRSIRSELVSRLAAPKERVGPKTP